MSGWEQVFSGESPADMRVDDGMAMVFDSDILEEEVEILGYPNLR